MSMRRKEKPSGNWIFTGISVTALLHMGLIAAFMNQDSGCVGGGDANAAPDEDRFAESKTIEAALAIQEVKPENKQPVKKKKEKYKPDERGVSRDEERKPEEKKEPEHKVPVLPDEVDVDSILKKNRSQDETLSSTGADEVPTEGATKGSIWGTEREAKGHKYVGELKGRIHSEWKVPTLETGGGVTLGCVRLSDDGKIIDHGLKQRSSNANLNRSVSIALKKAPQMEDPVPAELKELLTVKGICFRFSLEQQ
jgi:hypothetical protein